MLFALSSNSVATAAPFAKGKLIWTGKNDGEITLLHYGDAGLYWKNTITEWEDEEDSDYARSHTTDSVFYYDGKKVEQIADLKNRMFYQVKAEGITVSVISEKKKWGDFLIKVEIDGKEQIVDHPDSFPYDLQIRYPLITWKEKDMFFENVLAVYDLEKREKTTNLQSYRKMNRKVVKFDGEGIAHVFRPFEYVDGEEDQSYYHSMTIADKQAFWQEPGGVYQDNADDDEFGYMRLSEDSGVNVGTFAVDDKYVVWNREKGLGVYSLDKKETYLLRSDLLGDKPQDLLINQGNAAVLEEQGKRYQIKLLNYEDLLKQKNAKYVQVEKPERLTPSYLEGVVSTLPDDTYWGRVLVSPSHLFWYEEWLNWLYQKRGQTGSKLLYWNSFDDPVFIGDTLYMYNEAFFSPDEDEDQQEEEKSGIYRLDLETEDSELVYQLDRSEQPDELFAFDGKLYWYDEDKQSIFSLNPENRDKTKINLQSEDVTAWTVHQDRLFWVDRLEERYMLKMKRGEHPIETLLTWQEEDERPYQLTADEKKLYWTSVSKEGVAIHQFDLAVREDTVIDKINEQVYPVKLTLNQDSLYYLVGDFSRDGQSRLMKYDLEAKKTSMILSNTIDFSIEGESLVFVKKGRNDRAFYLFDKKLAEAADISLSYTWKELEQNDDRLWNDLRYTFHSDDIIVSSGSKKYTWTKLMEDQRLWKKWQKQKEKIHVTINL